MPKCIICGGTEFYAEDGFYFCNECQTQQEDVREELLEFRADPNTRLRKIRIRQDKSSKTDENLGWTTWEQYNFILIGITNELIELGASVDIKMTILQLWAYYLGKVEVAFTSTSKRSVPRLARKFHKRDAEIIYGKIAKRKKKRRRSTASNTSASSIGSIAQSEESSRRELNKQKKRMIAAEYERFVQSQDSSEGDALSLMNQSLFSIHSSAGRSSSVKEDNIKFNKEAKKETSKVKVLSMKLTKKNRIKYRDKHSTTQYKMGPQVITPIKLWALVYLALRIHDESIHLADMLRYGREGHLSYYKLDHLLPPEVKLSKSETNLLHQTKEITHKGMRRIVGCLAKFLDVWQTRKPNLLMLIQRYVIELQLPKGIMLYAERLLAISPPKMPFNSKTPCFPNYEGRAMAFVIVVMKILLGLDGITEHEISRVAEKINSAAGARGVLDSKLFSFREWQRYIECRRCLLTNLHFPTKLKREPDSCGNYHLYLNFLAAARSKSSGRETPEVTSYKHLLPRELADAMKISIEKLTAIAPSVPKDVVIFRPSTTPQYSYLEQLLEDPLAKMPMNLHEKFHTMKIGYMTKPEMFQTLAAQCGIYLDITDKGIHFIEKIVPTFEQSSLPTFQEFNKPLKVQEPGLSKLRSRFAERERFEDTIEYLHCKNPGDLFVDPSKRVNYEITRKSLRERRHHFAAETCDDFAFDDVLPSGKLSLINDTDSDNESVRSVSNEKGNDLQRNSNDTGDLCIDFVAKYNVVLSNFEKTNLLDASIGSSMRLTHKKSKHKLIRDSITGKFVSPNLITKLENIENVKLRTGFDRRCLLRDSETAKLIETAERNLRASEEKNDEATQIVESESNYDYALDDDEISILRENSFNSTTSDINSDPTLDNNSCNESEKLFRPYTEYWMYRCNFSRVKQKNFRQLERNFPDSFRWLLTECASVVEMAEEDLYEEICLVESIYVDILKPTDNPSTENQYNTEEYQSKSHCNAVINKW